MAGGEGNHISQFHFGTDDLWMLGSPVATLEKRPFLALPLPSGTIAGLHREDQPERIEEEMTIVAAVSTTFDAVVIADCRLSGVDAQDRLIVARDICQKLFVPNGWSVLAFAGDLCLGRTLIRGVFSRLQTTDPFHSDWLRDDREILSFIAEGIARHSRVKADHSQCRRKTVQLLIAWVDYTRSIIEGDHNPGDESFVPGTQLIVVETPSMTVQHRGWGLEIIGTGKVITQPMREEAMMKIANMGRGQEKGDSHRCFFTAVVVNTLLQGLGIPSIGGLYQMLSLSLGGVEVIPYLYWVPVESGYGTYVAMRIEDGEWVQEHRPTGTKIKVLPPSAIQLRGPHWTPGKDEMFEPTRSLTRFSPGVVRETNLQPLYWIYDPGNVPDIIRASWGSDPLPPLTWSTDQLPRQRGNML